MTACSSLGNSGVGDMEGILESERVGVAVRGFGTAELAAGVRRLVDLARDPDIQQRCRRVALDRFALDAGVAAYAAIYDRLLSSAPGGQQAC